MKKLIAALICAALILLPALAEEIPNADAPAGDESSQRQGDSGETIELEVDGQRIALEFDGSPEYSSVEGGVVQASYYSYSDDGATLYEFYLIFPDTVQPGMVITPEYAALTNEESSVVLIVSDTLSGREQYYFSSLMDGGVYPEGSTYEISIDDIQQIDGATTYAGRFSATLVALNMASGEADAVLEIPETGFRFTLGGGTGERHADPLPTEMPGDMRKV